MKLNPELERRVLELAGDLRPEPPVDEDASEKQFQAEVVKLAKKNGWRVYHTHDSRKSAAGFPDLTMVRRCRLIFAELKVGKKTPTADQQNWLDDLRRVPGQVGVFLWRPSDWPQIVALLEAP
jgi:hypothetical protein